MDLKTVDAMIRQHNLRCSALRFVRRAIVAWLVTATFSALAHDTWFEAKRRTVQGGIIVALGTGNRFPVQEYPISAEQVKQHGCRQSSGSVPFAAVTNSSTALLLCASPASRDPVTCWAQLISFDIELPKDKIETYLAEIHASQAVREAWLAIKARGLPWKERYTKHARIEFAGDTQTDPSVQQAPPIEIGMDVILESGLQPIRAGDPLVFQVRRDGTPLADFEVELLSDRHDVSIWRKTDPHGRIRVEVPLSGRWVLRGTDLRLSQTHPDTWESRFVTLAFDVETSQPTP